MTEKNMLEVHARALCAHCESLGMNAENMQAVMRDYSAPYNDESYNYVLKKWNLINEKGEPTF